MLQEEEYNIEQIKQKIDFHRERLKFIDSFYLPLLTGIALLLEANNSMQLGLKLFWALLGCHVLGVLTIVKFEKMIIIRKLIEQL